MNGYWLAANVVLGVHVSLFPALAAGSLAAALGVLRQYPRLSLVFWVTLMISALWQTLPSCILTDVERWLRHRVNPGWDRTISVQRVLIRELLGVDLQERVFWWMGVLVAMMAGYGLWKYHRDQVLDALRWLWSRPEAG